MQRHRLSALASLLALTLSLAAPVAPAQILVSDFNLDRIVQVAADGSSATVLVASGAGGLDLPHRSRLGPDGLLYVASAGTDQILRFNASTGVVVDTFAGPGGGALDYPVDLVFRPDGYLYVSSQLTNTILRYDASSGARDIAWSVSHADLVGPSGLVFDDDGHLYVAGRFSNNVVRFDAATGAHELTLANVPSAFGLALAPDGRLLAASGTDGTVLAFSAPAAAAPSRTTLISGLALPVGLELNPPTGELLVANYSGSAVTRHDLTDGALLGPLNTGGLLNGPNFLTAIPEPATASTLAAVAAFVFAATRRRRIRRL